jgi:hypothetical protein
MAELFKFKSYQGEPEQTIMKCLMKIIFLSISPHHKKEAFLNAVSKIVDEFMYAFELEQPINGGGSVLAHAKELLSLGMMYLHRVYGCHL